MLSHSLSLPSQISSSSIRKRDAMAMITSSKKANLFAKSKEKVRLPKYAEEFPISEFLAHPSGIETLLNKRALQRFEPVDLNTYRCTLHRIQLLQFDAVPVVDLRVTPTSEDCKVEMLSCKFEGSRSVVHQNNLFSAFMINHITWEENGIQTCLEVNVNLKVTLEIYTQPFNLLPVSVIEKPGNLVMQGLTDKLVSLLIEQLLKDYGAWVEKQSNLSSKP
ncbi:uncharacterized protein LOC109842985 isoform X2 [Asparagus officinalis]|uniref:uncharacterized protein LOC109842985 isoform X2 n=1 Tax=Asparagus officinalis TaxID=4686 RepID=UPI00098E13BE|nr:uncharacterized protein LOC109842985 isoform X2 [Asparagus officinalis]